MWKEKVDIKGLDLIQLKNLNKLLLRNGVNNVDVDGVNTKVLI